jgi:hypothetical protein
MKMTEASFYLLHAIKAGRPADLWANGLPAHPLRL